MAQAKQFYETSVPVFIRNLGDDAVVKFFKGKHASHIKSVKHHPQLANNAQNIIWEFAKKNLQRGSNDMTRKEQLIAVTINSRDATAIVAVQTLKGSLKGTVQSVLVELPTSSAENLILVIGGKIDVSTAAKNVRNDLCKAGFAGASSGAVFTLATALGAGPALTATGPFLAPLGVAAGATVVVYRVGKAIVIAMQPKPKPPHWTVRLRNRVKYGVVNASLSELPISLIENAIYAANKKKSLSQCAVALVADVSSAAVAGGVSSSGFFALGLIGAGPTLAAIAPVLSIYGTVATTTAVLERWLEAADTLDQRLALLENVHTEHTSFFEERKNRIYAESGA